MQRFPSLSASLAVTFLFATSTPAQQPGQNTPAKPALSARNFYFDDYRSVVHLDMSAVRACGLWDDLQTTPIAMITGMIETEHGFGLETLDRVTSVRASFVDDGGEARLREVTTLEGNDDLGLPSHTEHRYQSEELAGHTLYVDQWGAGEGMVMVGDKLRVFAPARLLREVLKGAAHAGVPAGDVLSLTVGQQRLLGYVVLDLGIEERIRDNLLEGLGEVDWPEGDAPTFFCVRLRATGDEDDPHLALEMVVRHGTAGDGLAITEKAVAAALERLKKMKEARLFLPILRKVEAERDGTDAVWRVDLGRSRQVAGLLGNLAPFFLVAGEAQVQGQAQALPAQVQVVEEVQEEVLEVEEPPPPPPEPAPENGGGH